MDPLFFTFFFIPFLLGKKKGASAPVLKKNGFSFYTSNLKLINLTSTADKSIRKYKRDASSIKGVVIHQTGFNWDDHNVNWNNTNAHGVVTREGNVIIIHDPIIRLTHGSNDANEEFITLEHEGNYKSINGKCFMPEKFGCDNAPTVAQIEASRKLISNFKMSYPNFSEITGHIQWDKEKSNCPGPQIWYNIGEWTIKNLGLKNGPTSDWYDDRGAPIPNEWRSSKYKVV